MKSIVRLRTWDYTRKYRRRNPHARPPFRYVYVLHIGKTGGTFLKQYTKNPTRRAREDAVIVSFGHNIKHDHLPREAEFIFATRDPVARFVSGFGSRFRRGPTGQKSWSRAEAWAFERFPEVSALAEALASADSAIQRDAHRAMRAIRHVNEPQHSWFGDEKRLLADIAAGRAHRLRQETLTQDVIAVLERIGCPVRPDLIEEMRPVHTAPSREATLSAEAQEAVREFYSKDYAFLKLLEDAQDAVDD
jgi:hypothetical protein